MLEKKYIFSSHFLLEDVLASIFIWILYSLILMSLLGCAYLCWLQGTLGLQVLAFCLVCGALGSLWVLIVGKVFTLEMREEIIVCSEYLKINRKTYNWAKINRVRFGWVKFADDGDFKYPVLFLEFFRPVQKSTIHFNDEEKLAPMKPKNIQEYVLDYTLEKQHSEIMRAISLYKKVESTIEISAYTD